MRAEHVVLAPAQAPARALRLTDVAAAIWDLLEYPARGTEVCAAVAAQAGIDEIDVGTGVRAFLDDLRARDLVSASYQEPDRESRLRNSHLRLLKRSLSGMLQPETEVQLRHLWGSPPRQESLTTRQRELRDLSRDPHRVEALLRARRVGSGTSATPHTLIGLTGLDNIEACAERVFQDAVLGDFLEAGVFQGGAAIFMRGLQVAHGEAHRRTWAADSFAGCPPPEAAPDVAFGVDLSEPAVPLLFAPLPTVRDNFARYGLLDGGVVFLPGWFAATLPEAPVQSLAILRIDADLYESTRQVLTALYERVSPGGFVIIDDYLNLAPVRQAVDEFRAAQGIAGDLELVDDCRAFWRKA